MCTHDKLISIVIPVYNAEDFLEDCFNSLVVQSYKKMEIIFVDDGSTDTSYKKCQGFAQKDSRVRVYTKVNGGQSSARRFGIEKAKGEYIGFVDADDWVEGEMYEAMLDKIETYSADFVICGLKKINKAGEVTPGMSVLSGLYEGRFLLSHFYAESEYFRLNVSGYLFTALFKKNVLEESMYVIDERINFSEDFAWLAVACFHADRVYIMQDQLYCYRKHEKSFTNLHNDNQTSQRLLYQNLSNVFRKKNAPKEAYKQLNYLIIANLMVGGYDYFQKRYNFLFPFKVIHKGAKIILYGAGKCGREIFFQITRDKKYDVVAWVDRDWKVYDSKDILPVESILLYQYDFVAIAILNQTVSYNVKEQLMEIGIQEQKIVVMDSELLEYEAKSLEYLW